MIILDTSVLVRFFTNDDPVKAKKVAELLDLDETLFLPQSVALELAFTLKKTYSASKDKIVTALQYLTTKKNIKFDQYLNEAVELFSNLNLSLADCLILVVSQKDASKVATFDAALRKVLKKESYW